MPEIHWSNLLSSTVTALLKVASHSPTFLSIWLIHVQNALSKQFPVAVMNNNTELELSFYTT